MIRVLLADDHRIIRDGLRVLLEQEPDMHVVAEADNGREAVTLSGFHVPQVVVMDVGMPELNGVEATRQVLEDDASIRILGLSMHTDRRFVMSMLNAGASGYLQKDCAFDELVNAVRTVAAGGMYLSPCIAGLVVRERLRLHGGADPVASSSPGLTPKETEVAQLVANGICTSKMATLLGTSIKTAETHRHDVMSKLGIRSVAGLSRFAIREGLTILEP
jgi:DNA-binding NarL/FixJ family response regulator